MDYFNFLQKLRNYSKWNVLSGRCNLALWITVEVWIFDLLQFLIFEKKIKRSEFSKFWKSCSLPIFHEWKFKKSNFWGNFKSWKILKISKLQFFQILFSIFENFETFKKLKELCILWFECYFCWNLVIFSILNFRKRRLFTEASLKFTDPNERSRVNESKLSGRF